MRALVKPISTMSNNRRRQDQGTPVARSTSGKKTIKAGDHGVPGGENMLLRDDGLFGYFTVRESRAFRHFRTVTILHGAWSEAMRQKAMRCRFSLHSGWQ